MTEHRDIIDIRLPDRLTREQHDPAHALVLRTRETPGVADPGWGAEWYDVILILGIFAGGMLGLVLLGLVLLSVYGW